MAEYLSYDHAINVVRGLYEEQGFDLHGKTPGKSVTDELGQDIKSSKLGALFAMIDELIFILRYQNYYLSGCLFKDSNEHCVTNLRFCTGMLSTLCSIRALSGMGLDLNARAQLRYYYELALLWSRVQLDSDARKSFESTDLKGSNKFWHSYLSRRKCENYLYAGAEAGDFEWCGASAKEHLDDIYEKLSISAHPGLLGLYINTSDDFGSMKDSIIGRGPDNATNFTLSSAILLTTLPFGVGGVTDWNYESPLLFDVANIYPSNKNDINWATYCHELRKMIMGLALFSFRFSTELSGGKW